MALRQADRDVLATCTEQSIVFEIMLADMARANGIRSAEFGSPQHLREVWQWSMQPLLARGEGDQCKVSRWFNWENCARRSLPTRFLDLMAILWLGWQRKWWRSALACPLYGGSFAAADDADAALLGEERAGVGGDVGDAMDDGDGGGGGGARRRPVPS